MKTLITTTCLLLLTSGCNANEATQIEVIPPPTQEIAVTKETYLLMRPTGRTNRFGNPIYRVSMFVDGREIGALTAVTGRAHTQSRNRNQSGTEAPLPNGKYRVSHRWIPGTIKEAGSKFLPITPLFSTGRTELGFHVDPSFNINQKEDGTAGCIGLTSVEELELLFRFVQQHKPSYLQVEI